MHTIRCFHAGRQVSIPCSVIQNSHGQAVVRVQREEDMHIIASSYGGRMQQDAIGWMLITLSCITDYLYES